MSISGTQQVGQVLTGDYAYADTEGDIEGSSTYKWYRAENFDGSDKQVIAGATSKTYTLTSDDKEKYIFFEVTPVAQSGDLVGLPVMSVASPIEVPTPAMLTTTRIQNGAGNTLGKVETGDQIIIDYNKPMDADGIGQTFNISFIHGYPTIMYISSTKMGRIAMIRTNAGTYTDGPPYPAIPSMNFNGSIGVWSNSNKTLTITLAVPTGDASQAAGTINSGTLTLYNLTAAKAADGTSSVSSDITTTDTTSF